MVLGHLVQQNSFGRKANSFLHILMAKDFPDVDSTTIKNVVGIDLGLNFIAVTYDSKDITTFLMASK